MRYKFVNILGKFLFDEKLNIISVKDDSSALPLPPEKIPAILSSFKDKKYFAKFYQENLKLTREAIKNAVNEDQLLMQTICNIGELDKVSNLLIKRLREWYSLYLPELSELVTDHEQFLELTKQTKTALLKKFNLSETMGADLLPAHLEQMKLLCQQIINIYELRKSHETYLKNIMQNHCPNLLELAGATIGAKLIDLANGLKQLALLPASTVQLLGAEKALFRHIKTGSRSPKHGIIINHPLVQGVNRSKKGKAARMLADKLSLCARLDYFKGELKAKQYRQELEEALR